MVNAVQAWYSNPAHFLNTDIESKTFDWNLLRQLGYAELLENRRIVNLGPCGLDEVMLARLCRQWRGVDFSAPLIAHLNTWQFPGRELVRYDVADFRELPYGDRSCDTVLDYSSTDHVQDQDRPQVRREIFRVLEHGRYYVVTYPNACWINHERETVEFGYERRFTPAEMEEEIRAAGFTITQHNRSGVRSGLVAWKPQS